MHRESADRMTRPSLTGMGVIAVLSMSTTAFADVVHFENGDRLTGDLVDAPANFVAIDVPQVGVVTVPRGRVTRVEEDGVEDPEVADETTTGSAPTVPDTDTDRRWEARADLGMAVATGNTRATDLNFVAGVGRHGQRFDNVLGVVVHKARAQGPRRSDGGSTTTKDQIDLDYNLRWKYGDAWYAVATFEYFQDPIKDVDQRATTGAGVGHTFWESDRGALRTDAGISRVFEEIRLGPLAAADGSDGSNESDNNPALRWGLQFNRWLVADRLEIFHNNQLLHIFDGEPSSVWDSDTGIRFHVNSRWLAALRVDLQHETAPSAGRRKTDSSYAVALGVKL